MKTNAIAEKASQHLHALPGGPSLVITLPFEPKTMAKSGIELMLKDAQAHAARQLMAEYPRYIALPFVNRLQQLVLGLNWSTHKKSIVLLVSAETEKVMYLDQPLIPQVLIDSKFRIRDLTVDPREKMQFLVLLLNSRRSKMYRSDGERLKLIKNNDIKTTYAYYRDLPEPTANFSDAAAQHQIMLDKFLHHMDEGLSIVLNADPLPVFVIATDKVLGHFSGITRNDRHIVAAIHKNCMKATEQELQDLLQPYLDDVKKLRQQIALKQTHAAQRAGKLITGIDDVTKEVRNRNNRTLVVERNWSAPAGAKHTQAPDRFYLYDRVDAIIEKVLDNGGQVEWVDKGTLDDLGHIALMKYY